MAVILATHHKALVSKLTPAFLKTAGVKIVLDARNSLDKEGIAKAGLFYKGVGR
jgi:hypothetical protein